MSCQCHNNIRVRPLPGPGDGVHLVRVAHQHRLDRYARVERTRLKLDQRRPVRAGPLGEDEYLGPVLLRVGALYNLPDRRLARMGILPAHVDRLGVVNQFLTHRRGGCELWFI